MNNVEDFSIKFRIFLNILNVLADFDCVSCSFVTRTINGAVLVVGIFGLCCEEATVWTDT